MSNDVWRWADPDGQQRKVRLDELRSALAGGLIAPNTPVWRSGWQDWQPAHEVPELTSASLGGANGVVLNIPPPPLAMVAVQQEYEAAAGSLAATATATTQLEEEPPPPPPYVPAAAKSPSIHPSSGQLKTQIGGSAHVPVAPGSSPGAIRTATGPSPSPVAPGSGPRLGSNLPTTIGIPPPPEVLAGASAAAARPRSAPPPAPPAKPRAPAADMIEEISSSMLLDSSPSSSALPSSVGHADDGLPAPTDPIVRTGSTGEIVPDDVEHTFLPRRPGLSLILDDIAEMRQGRPPKNKLLIGVLAVVALSVVIMLVAGIAAIASGSSSTEKTALAKSASPAASSVPPTAATVAAMGEAATARSAIPAPPPAETKPAPTFGDCTVSGGARTIAPRALIASAIEAHALGDGLALAFAASPRDAVVTSLDPATLAPTTTVRTKPAGGDARRVTPVLVNGKLTALPDVDRKGDHIASRRVVVAGKLIDVGYADGAVVWAPHGKDSFAKLFELEGDAPIEALRAIALKDREGVALTFRRGNAIHIGVARGDGVLEPEGGLSTITGLGQVGSPAIAASGDHVIAAWADRAEEAEWNIRWTKVMIGGTTSEAKSFTLPGGGLGGQSMSPSLASLGGGRFLLAWTEGPVSNHQVRAITIDASGAPSGSPMDISSPGDNAGQPAVVVGPDGRGAVAFLAAKGKSLEVHATPISCPPR